MPLNLGEIDELKIAIDSMYIIHRAYNTLERLTGLNYFKDPTKCIEESKVILENLKKKLADIK